MLWSFVTNKISWAGETNMQLRPKTQKEEKVKLQPGKALNWQVIPRKVTMLKMK